MAAYHTLKHIVCAELFKTPNKTNEINPVGRMISFLEPGTFLLKTFYDTNNFYLLFHKGVRKAV